MGILGNSHWNLGIGSSHLLQRPIEQCRNTHTHCIKVQCSNGQSISATRQTNLTCFDLRDVHVPLGVNLFPF